MVATDADALLATILANPADDAPRLVYADWLDEHGEGERAEFVRVQCELARLPCTDDASIPCHQCADQGLPWCENCLAAGPLPRRERELFDRHLCRWFGESWAILYTGSEQEDADGQYPDLTKAIISRGFIAEIRAPLATLLDTPGLRDLVRREPVEEVRVTDREPYHNGAGYSWFDVGRPRPSADVPEAAELPGAVFVQLGSADRRYWSYSTPAAAHAALGRAVLAHLRADG